MTQDNHPQDSDGHVSEIHGYNHDEDSSLGSIGGRRSRRRGSRRRGSRRRGSRHRSHRGGTCGLYGHQGGRKHKSKSSKHPKKNHKKSRTRRRRSHRV